MSTTLYPSRGQRAFARFLERNGISLAEASRALGVSNVAVREWKLGTKVPRDTNRDAIATWTNGEVSADSWPPPETHEVRPFRPTGTDR